MFDEVRAWNRKNNKRYVEIFLNVNMDILKKRNQKEIYSRAEKGNMKNVLGVDMPVEFPKNPDIVLENDGRYTIKECVDKILNYKAETSIDFNRDTDYWNKYYENRQDIVIPSLFAVEIGKQLNKSGSLLDLGCGNGRDSIYLYKLGLNVTAVDASDFVIKMLQEKYNDGNICFICDDFVCSSMIYTGQYDYCYSRFSLHAINEEQEDQVIANVYRVLKPGGKFFVEVRSINDDLYGKGENVGNDSYIYNGHFRRFIKCEILEKKMVNIGFKIEYSREQKGFAPLGDSDPPIIRMILLK